MCKPESAELCFFFQTLAEVWIYSVSNSLAQVQDPSTREIQEDLEFDKYKLVLFSLEEIGFLRHRRIAYLLQRLQVSCRIMIHVALLFLNQKEGFGESKMKIQFLEVSSCRLLKAYGKSW